MPETKKSLFLWTDEETALLMKVVIDYKTSKIWFSPCMMNAVKFGQAAQLRKA